MQNDILHVIEYKLQDLQKTINEFKAQPQTSSDNTTSTVVSEGSITADKTIITESESIQEHCKKHRLWAAKDYKEKWATFKTRPSINKIFYYGWGGTAEGLFEWDDFLRVLSKPEVDWDKSLIAPDGRLILIEGKKKKEPKKVVFKPGRYYKLKKGKDIIYCDSVGLNSPDDLEWVNGEIVGKGGFGAYLIPSIWYELKKFNPNKKKKWVPKRGEPIFVWADNVSFNLPAHVEHFHSFYKGKVYDFSWTIYGKKGKLWPNWRKYDPALVGVPRKDWPKE